MEERGRKKSAYINLLHEIVVNEYKSEFVVNNKVVLPKRKSEIYNDLSTRLSENKFKTNSNAVYHALYRHIHTFFNIFEDHDKR